MHICPPSGLGSMTNDGVYLCWVCTCSMLMWGLYRGCLYMRGHSVTRSVRCRNRKAITGSGKVECLVMTVYSKHTSSFRFVSRNWSEYIIMCWYSLPTGQEVIPVNILLMLFNVSN